MHKDGIEIAWCFPGVCKRGSVSVSGHTKEHSGALGVTNESLRSTKEYEGVTKAHLGVTKEH